MGVVKNLMIRIGADYSAMNTGMSGASQRLGRFQRDTERTTAALSGKRGLGGVTSTFKNLGTSVTSSLTQIKGAKGVGGLASSLGSLRPVIGSASKGLTGLGASAGGATAALGAAALGVTAVVAVMAVATVGIYQASQAAVKFEADLGRLNMQLKGNSKEFMTWARSLGLAKSTAAEMGATYGTLLSAFTSDNNTLANQTKQLVQATRVVASATGRTIDDTTERIRSGLLGNTEAIEDLGIFVNVSMIESTNAFKKFANGKHWDQLDFRIQQQIRLQAILEQAQARYGNNLQNNVMTKQTLLMEQLKDVKLNFSQAFLPIWDSILPALNSLASSLAYVTEQGARFTYWLRGWDYDERTQGLDKQTGAIDGQSSALDDLTKSSKAAKKELASFDQLNTIDGSGTGGTSGTTGGTGGGAGGNGGPNWNMPDIAPILTKKYRINFDPPNPPDAGAGGVASAVDGTMNDLITNTRSKWGKMWADLGVQSQVGIAAQTSLWGGWSNGLVNVTVPAMTLGVSIAHGSLWDLLQLQALSGVAGLQAAYGILKADWHGALDYMQSQINAYEPYISYGVSLIGASVLALSNPLASLKMEWHGALDYLQSQLNAYNPYLQFGFATLGLSVLSVINPLETLESVWSKSLISMSTVAVSSLSPILTIIDKVQGAWDKLSSVVSGISGVASSVQSSVSNGASSIGSWASSSFSDMVLNKETYSKIWDQLKGEAAKPENQAGAAIVGTAIPFVGAASKLGQAGNALKALVEIFKGAGIAVPAFAGGATVFGPTLAMVGDNAGARSDPELIGPASMFQEYLDASGSGGDNGDVVAMLRAILQATEKGQQITVQLDGRDVARSTINTINDITTQTGRSPLKS